MEINSNELEFAEVSPLSSYTFAVAILKLRAATGLGKYIIQTGNRPETSIFFQFIVATKAGLVWCCLCSSDIKHENRIGSPIDWMPIFIDFCEKNIQTPFV